MFGVLKYSIKKLVLGSVSDNPKTYRDLTTFDGIISTNGQGNLGRHN
jgi:hypothetical protein